MSLELTKYFLSLEGWPMSSVKYWGHYWCLLTQCFLLSTTSFKNKKEVIFMVCRFPPHSATLQTHNHHSLQLVFLNQNHGNWCSVQGAQTDVFPDSEDGDNQVGVYVSGLLASRHLTKCLLVLRTLSRSWQA